MVNEENIEIDDEAVIHPKIEACFGKKVALGVISADWKVKEMAMKH